jgi:hypothetical protein
MVFLSGADCEVGQTLLCALALFAPDEPWSIHFPLGLLLQQAFAHHTVELAVGLHAVLGTHATSDGLHHLGNGKEVGRLEVVCCMQISVTSKSAQ